MKKSSTKPSTLIYLALLFVFLLLMSCGEEKTDSLTVYVYDSFEQTLQDNISEYFKNEYDVNVKFKVFEDTNFIINAIVQEKKNPQCDVAIGIDNSFLPKAEKHDIFQEYKPSNFIVRDNVLIFDKSYKLTPFDYGFICFNYNSEMLDKVPEVYMDLTDNYYKDKIIMLHPKTSSPGRTFLLFTVALFGEQDFISFWKALKPNIKTIASSWGDAYYGIYYEGIAPIVLSYSTSPAYHIEVEKEHKYKNLLIEGKAYAQIEGAGIVKGSKNITNAKRLIDYLISEDFQKLIPMNQWMYPVHPDVELPEGFKSIDDVEIILNLDEDFVSENFDKWLNEWEKVF